VHCTWNWQRLVVFRSSAERKNKTLVKILGGGRQHRTTPAGQILGVATPAIPAALTPMLTYYLLPHFLLSVKCSLKWQIFYLNRPNCRQLPPSTLSMHHCTTFQADSASLFHCNLSGIIQHLVWATVVYPNFNEMKLAYGVAQLHWQKRYWQCNWWVVLAFLGICVAYNGRYEQPSWQYQYLFSHTTWNI